MIYKTLHRKLIIKLHKKMLPDLTHQNCYYFVATRLTHKNWLYLKKKKHYFTATSLTLMHKNWLYPKNITLLLRD